MPLTVQSYPFTRHSDLRFGPALELIASPSVRRESAKILNSPYLFRYFSSIHNNLRLLKTLELDIGGVGLAQLDLLAFVRSVVNLTVHGSIEFASPRLPLEGLVTYNCVGLLPNTMRWSVASMSRLSDPCAVFIGASLEGSWALDGERLDIPQTTSNIGSLSLQLDGTLRSASSLQALDEIFAALTLPSLCKLSFAARDSLPWPHPQFMAFSIRSSFDTHLLSLNLSRVHVTEPELIHSLSTLPALQSLSIGDHFPKPLVTDSLLTALARLPENSTTTPCLVPHLQVLDCVSELRFDDNVYLAFLISRCASQAGGLSTPAPFVSRMRCPMAYYERSVNSEVAAQIKGMCARRVLNFEWLK
ncbi:hypothetical protein C8R45DRAFT_1219004 [Mycena sanguinolenta]|nr:hypothetical protein C8R45DRAFT_1219004 [Mycena sanguinolenta]